jgi:hypothetical protein
MKRFSVFAFLVVWVAAVLGNGCQRRAEQSTAASNMPAPASATPGEDKRERAISRLHPAQARIGESFNRQPNGSSAIAVVGTGFVRSDKVFWGDQPLKTVFGSETTLTAEVPPTVLSQPGDVQISVKDPTDPQSTEIRATFRLLPRNAE